jgi:predicted lipoprotein
MPDGQQYPDGGAHREIGRMHVAARREVAVLHPLHGVMLVLPITIRYQRQLGVLALAAVLAALWVAGLVATVKPIAGASARDSFPAAGLAFKPKAYVARIWAKRVVPDVRKESVALTGFLSAVSKNKAAALHRFGNKVANAYNVLVHFTGTVGRIDTSSPIGTITVDVPAGAKQIAVKVATGPVILGTTLRDSLKFISFGEFLNQIQYGDVADALNSRVVHDVIAPLDLGKLKGRSVTVYGAYTFDGSAPDDITVTPVIFESRKGTPG